MSQQAFGEKQEINGWQLGFYDGQQYYQGQTVKPPQTLAPAGFAEMNKTITIWGYEWHGGTSLIKQGMLVPEGKSWPVMRWHSTVDEKVFLRGFFKTNKKNPAPITASIYVDGKSVFSKEIKGQKEFFEIETNVKKGSSIDFVAASVGPKGQCQMQSTVSVKNPSYTGK